MVIRVVRGGRNNRYGESGPPVSIPHVNLPILLHLILIPVSLDVRPGRTKPVISNLEIPELVLGFPHLSSQHSESQPIITTWRVQSTGIQDTQNVGKSSQYRVPEYRVACLG